MEGRDSTRLSPLDERLETIRHRTIGRSEVIRLRLQRVDALQAELWKRMDRLERERREHEGLLEARASQASTAADAPNVPRAEMAVAS